MQSGCRHRKLPALSFLVCQVVRAEIRELVSRGSGGKWRREPVVSKRYISDSGKDLKELLLEIP